MYYFTIIYAQVLQASYDFIDDDQDPSNHFPWHGTSCGGIIGSAKDGRTCGVGIAYNSNLGGKYTFTCIKT